MAITNITGAKSSLNKINAKGILCFIENMVVQFQHTKSNNYMHNQNGTKGQHDHCKSFEEAYFLGHGNFIEALLLVGRHLFHGIYKCSWVID